MQRGSSIEPHANPMGTCRHPMLCHGHIVPPQACMPPAQQTLPRSRRRCPPLSTSP